MGLKCTRTCVSFHGVIERPLAVAAAVVAVHVVHPLEEEISYWVAHQGDVHVAEHHVVAEGEGAAYRLDLAATNQIEVLSVDQRNVSTKEEAT